MGRRYLASPGPLRERFWLTIANSGANDEAKQPTYWPNFRLQQTLSQVSDRCKTGLGQNTQDKH
jgi:hypothetical protein